METIQNSLLTMAAPKAPQGGKQPSRVSGGAAEGKDSFQKLMEKQTEQAPEEKAPEVSAEQAPQQEETGIPEEQDLESRMALAALALVNAPVPIQTEPVLPEEGPELMAAVQLPEETQTAAPQLPNTKPVEVLETPVESQEQTAPVEAQNREAPVKLAPDAKTETVQTTEQKPEQPMEQKKADVTVEVKDAWKAPEEPLFREVKAVPIQVGETTAAEKTEPEAAEVQVGRRLVEAIRSGESRVELELDPKALGKVHIELAMRQDGSLHVLLRAEKPSTQALLDRGSGELQSLLGRDARQDVYVETGRSQEEQNQAYYNQPQEQERRQEQQQNRQRQHPKSGEDFLHQLRLGLTPVQDL